MIKGLKKLHSAEPACRKRSDNDHLRFMIHEKDHPYLKFDFIIELNGVKGWSIHDFPSMNPLDQRLAREDKKKEEVVLDTVDEEKISSKKLWDKGNYIPLDDNGNVLSEFEAFQSLENGSLKFFLQGNKLTGEFVLMKKRKKNWLLIKRHDEFALYQEFQIEGLAD